MKIILAHYGSDRYTRCIGLLNDTEDELEWINEWLLNLKVSPKWWIDTSGPYEEAPKLIDIYHTRVGEIQKLVDRYIVRPADNTPSIKKD